MATPIKGHLLTPAIIYGLLALFVMLPLLPAGHILTLDMAFTPELPMPETTSSSFLFRLLLYLLNTVLPTHVIEKLLFFTILMLASLSMHRLLGKTFSDQKATEGGEWSMYVAGAIYAINPFTYSRFMAGQYSVLLGYALLPLFVYALLEFLNRPNPRKVVPLIGSTLAISIVSIHSLGPVAILTITGLTATIWRYRRRHKHRRSIFVYGLLATITIIIASSYWLIPFMSGESLAGQAAQNYTATDRLAYATVGDGLLGKFINVLRLQGFWAESRNLYLLPQDVLPGWGLVTIGVWLLVWQGGRSMVAGGRRYEAFIFGTSGLAAAILAVQGIGDWALSIVPELGGFRESHKFVSLLALAFAYFVGVGIHVMVTWLRARGETLAAFGMCLALMLPVLWTPTMFWGFAGQLRPRNYPADWFAANEQLNQDPDDFKTIFLPWHLYMHFRFAGRIIVNPAADFFDKHIVFSNDPELSGSSLVDQDPLKQKLSAEILPTASTDSTFGEKLAAENIKYVLLAKEVDTENYAYLRAHNDLKLVFQSDTLDLYQNEAWEAHDAP